MFHETYKYSNRQNTIQVNNKHLLILKIGMTQEQVLQEMDVTDRLPCAAVDEFIQRGDRMVEPLSEIMINKYEWTEPGPEWWAVVHAVYILGAIGGREAILPLLQATRWTVAYDCDGVTEELPSIFGTMGVVVIDDLKKIASDRTSDWDTRTIAIDGLAAIIAVNK